MKRSSIWESIMHRKHRLGWNSGDANPLAAVLRDEKCLRPARRSGPTVARLALPFFHSATLQESMLRHNLSLATVACCGRENLSSVLAREILSMRFLRFALIVFSGLIGALLVAWSAGALYFDLPASPLLRTTAPILWAAGAV